MNINSKKFNKNGFVEIKNVFSIKELNRINIKFKKIYSGKYSTQVAPDKVWWKKGDSKKIPRLLANVWKSDYDIASIVFSKKLGMIAGLLTGWESVRVNEDSLIWVPPNSEGLRFHQDNPYHKWHYPGGVTTAWIPFTNTHPKAATLEYLIGSHKNNKSNNNKEVLKKYKKYFVNLKKGSVVFHHGNLWHGSGSNKTKKHRLSLAVHFMHGSSKFHKTIKNPYYNRFKLSNSSKMLEDFFPITWSNKNYKLNFVKKFLSKK